MLSKKSPIKNFVLIPESAAWIVIVLLSLLTVALIFVGAGNFLNVAFPFASLCVGAFLYFRYPILYHGFTWWIWFLVALIRRLADYYSSYTEPSPLLLAPFLVTGLTIITVFQYLPKIYRTAVFFPFLLSLVGILYGFSIGLINMPLFTVTKELLSWLVPLTYGFYLLINWRNFPHYYQNLQRVFAWGILVMGIYGIVQFLAIPEWDRLWLNSSGMFTAAGAADASGGTRVWSTMHSGEPFAAFMAGGLLLLLNKPGIVNLGASGAGYIAFLLTTARSAWIGWFAGILTLTTSLKAKYQQRLIITFLVLAVFVVPLANMEQFSGKLSNRFASFSNITEDGSFKGRQATFRNNINSALTNVVGDGIGTPGMDSALLSTIISLGWFGTICYVGGLIMLVLRLFQNSSNSNNLFLGTARGVIITCLIRVPLNVSATRGIGGMLLWGFLALAIASEKYYHHQRLIKTASNKPITTKQ